MKVAMGSDPCVPDAYSIPDPILLSRTEQVMQIQEIDTCTQAATDSGAGNWMPVDIQGPH